MKSRLGLGLHGMIVYCPRGWLLMTRTRIRRGRPCWCNRRDWTSRTVLISITIRSRWGESVVRGRCCRMRMRHWRLRPGLCRTWCRWWHRSSRCCWRCSGVRIRMSNSDWGGKARIQCKILWQRRGRYWFLRKQITIRESKLIEYHILWDKNPTRSRKAFVPLMSVRSIPRRDILGI